MSSAALWRDFTGDRTHTRSTDTPNPQHTCNSHVCPPPYQPFSSSSISDWVFSELHCKHHIMPASAHQTRYSRTLVVPLSSHSELRLQQTQFTCTVSHRSSVLTEAPIFHGSQWMVGAERRSAGSDRQTQLFLIPLSPSLSSQCRAGLV